MSQSHTDNTRMDFEKLIELSYTDRRGFLKLLAKGVAVTGMAGLGLQALPLREFFEPDSAFMGDWKGNFPLMDENGLLKLTDSNGSRFITREDVDSVTTPGVQALFTFLWDDPYWGSKSPGAIGRLETETGDIVYLAVSKKCTHEGCSVVFKNGEWFCPCHAARFDLDGAVVSGPPPAPQQVFDVDFDTSNRVKLTRIGAALEYY